MSEHNTIRPKEDALDAHIHLHLEEMMTSRRINSKRRNRRIQIRFGRNPYSRGHRFGGVRGKK